MNVTRIAPQLFFPDRNAMVLPRDFSKWKPHHATAKRFWAPTRRHCLGFRSAALHPCMPGRLVRAGPSFGSVRCTHGRRKFLQPVRKPISFVICMHRAFGSYTNKNNTAWNGRGQSMRRLAFGVYTYIYIYMYVCIYIYIYIYIYVIDMLSRSRLSLSRSLAPIPLSLSLSPLAPSPARSPLSSISPYCPHHLPSFWICHENLRFESQCSAGLPKAGQG